jgi:cell division protein ZapE
MPEPVSRAYLALAEAGHLEPDSEQIRLADRLDALLAALCDRQLKSKKSALGWVLSRGAKPEPVNGIYIWGAVGRGKTMLMDQFHAAVPNERKLRSHFHEFMADAHDRIHRFRQALKAGTVKGDDPIAPVAAAIAAETNLLSFDEFFVADIADAMILGRLFESLLEHGVTIVATSNVAPDELYKNGLNRELFLPFIALLKDRMEVFHLDAPRDFRLEAPASQPVYVVPGGLKADDILDDHFFRLTGVAKGEPAEIAHKGRIISVPDQACGVARFSFDGLCRRPLGAEDYLKIAHAYHTIILSDIPIMDDTQRNEARRFINLIDTLYDNRTRLVVSADAEPDRLWRGRDGHENLAFSRTASRLVEMRSDVFLGAERGTKKGAAAGDDREPATR